MRLNNMEIRQEIEKRRLAYFEVAAALGINPATFSRWLQTEMTGEKKQTVLEAIRSIKA